MATAYININQLNENLKLINKEINNKKIIAVIKANAYGHDSVIMAKELIKRNVDIFAVANIQEALKLRNNGILSDILILGETNSSLFYLIEKNNFVQTVFSYDYYKEIKKSEYKFPIHLKFDVGMNRLGFPIITKEQRVQTEKQIEEILKDKKNEIKGVFSHFNNAMDKKRSTKQQDIFFNFIKKFKFNYDILIHLNNSQGAMLYKENKFNAVRIGLLLYGIDQTKTIKVKPILSLYAKVISIKKIYKGMTISYGDKAKIKHNTNIAVISIGYADGISRKYSKKGFLSFGGKKIKIVGDITMDYLMVDIENHEIKVGDYLEIIGDNINVLEISKKLDTIPYEIFVNLGSRVERKVIYD